MSHECQVWGLMHLAPTWTVCSAMTWRRFNRSSCAFLQGGEQVHAACLLLVSQLFAHIVCARLVDAAAITSIEECMTIQLDEATIQSAVHGKCQFSFSHHPAHVCARALHPRTRLVPHAPTSTKLAWRVRKVCQTCTTCPQTHVFRCAPHFLAFPYVVSRSAHTNWASPR